MTPGAGQPVNKLPRALALEVTAPAIAALALVPAAHEDVVGDPVQWMRSCAGWSAIAWTTGDVYAVRVENAHLTVEEFATGPAMPFATAYRDALFALWLPWLDERGWSVSKPFNTDGDRVATSPSGVAYALPARKASCAALEVALFREGADVFDAYGRAWALARGFPESAGLAWAARCLRR